MKKKTPIPPILAEKLLAKVLRDDLAEEVLGNVEEKFYQVANHNSMLKAKCNYWHQTFNYLRPFAFRSFSSKFLNRSAMHRQYLKVSWRPIQTQKMYPAIKIGGFAQI
ncbi:MAG: permease prefix domain 2-containing transporter [Cyclobacteriaceae bacterium]